MNLLQRLVDWVTQPFHWLFGGVIQWFSELRPVWGIPLPWRLALFSFLLCLASAGMVLWLRSTAGSAPSWGWVVLIPMLLIPLGVWWLTHLWLLEPDVGDPEVLAAWNAGITTLADLHISLFDHPVILLHGVPDGSRARDLLRAAGYKLEHDGSTIAGPLQWFVVRALTNSDRPVIVISLPRVSALSTLFATSGTPPERGGRSSPTEPGASLTGEDSQWDDRADDQSGSVSESDLDDEPEPSESEFRGSLMGDDSEEGDGDWRGDNSRTPSSSGRSAPRLGEDMLQRSEERLAQVADLLKRVRAPKVPMNGLLTVLPFGWLDRSAAEITGLKSALRTDFEQLGTHLDLRFPATILVPIQMRELPGFWVLIDRLDRGKSRKDSRLARSREAGDAEGITRKTRFGKGGDPKTIASEDFIDAVVMNACGLFEERAMMLFEEPEGLAEPAQNRKLFAMVCALRTRVQPVLMDVLRHAFVGPDGSRGRADLVRLGGIYFAKLEKVPAFARSVLERVEEQIGGISWSERALAEDHKYRQWAESLRLINTLLFMLLVIAGVFWWFNH